MTDDYGHAIFESIKITLVRTARSHTAPTILTLARCCYRCATTACGRIVSAPSNYHLITFAYNVLCLADPEKYASVELPSPRHTSHSHVFSNAQVSAQAGVHAQARIPQPFASAFSLCTLDMPQTVAGGSPPRRWRRCAKAHMNTSSQCPLLTPPLHPAGPRVARRCACGFLPCPYRRAADRVCVPRAQRTRPCCARHSLSRFSGYHSPARPTLPHSSQFARVAGHLGRRLGEGLPHDGHRGDDEARARPDHLRRAQPGEQRQPHLRRVRPVGRRRLGLLGGVARAGRARLLARAPLARS